MPTATAERGQQGGVGEGLAGPCVGGGVGDDHAVDQLGPRGQHARVVGGVDGLREIAPAGQGGDAVLAEELDGGQHVRSWRQQPAVAERAEDPGVVGRGGPQLEELPLGGGDAVVEELPQFVGEAVQLLGGEGRFVGVGFGVRAAPPATGARYVGAGARPGSTARRVPMVGSVRSRAAVPRTAPSVESVPAPCRGCGSPPRPEPPEPPEAPGRLSSSASRSSPASARAVPRSAS